MATTARPQASLLSLPAEIRLKIIEYLLAPYENATIRIRTRSVRSFCLADPRPPPRRTAYQAPIPDYRPVDSPTRFAWSTYVRVCPRREFDAQFDPNARLVADVYNYFDPNNPRVDLRPWLYPAILRVNRPLYDEAVTVLYGRLHLFDFGADTPAAGAFLTSLGPKARRSLRRVRIAWLLIPSNNHKEELLPSAGFRADLEAWRSVCEMLATRSIGLRELQVAIHGPWSEKDAECTQDCQLRKEDFATILGAADELADMQFLKALRAIRGLERLQLDVKWHGSWEPCCSLPRERMQISIMQSASDCLRQYLMEEMVVGAGSVDPSGRQSEHQHDSKDTNGVSFSCPQVSALRQPPRVGKRQSSSPSRPPGW